MTKKVIKMEDAKKRQKIENEKKKTGKRKKQNEREDTRSLLNK